MKLKVTEIKPTETGQGKNGTWTSTIVITQEVEGNYPKTIALKFVGDKIPLPAVGQTYDFDFNIESREYNGRYYTELKVWRYNQDQTEPVQSVADNPTQTMTPKQDGLPF